MKEVAEEDTGYPMDDGVDVRSSPQSHARALLYMQIASLPNNSPALKVMSERWKGQLFGSPREFLRFHRTIRSFLSRLLAGETVSWPGQREGTYKMQLVNGAVYGKVLGTPFYERMSEVVWMCSGKRIPFSRCPTCRKFFLRRKRQKYCSRLCGAEGIETTRKGKRREYMRKYMHDRRRREKRMREKK